MELTKMTGKNLATWCRNLESWIRTETNQHNLELYTKWLAEARYEQNLRKQRIKNYLRWQNEKN